MKNWYVTFVEIRGWGKTWKKINGIFVWVFFLTVIKSQIALKHSNKMRKIIYFLMQPESGKKISISDGNENN